MFLQTVTTYWIYAVLYKSKNVENSFNSEFVEKSFFCIFEIISWVREVFDYLTYFGIFCKL